MAHVRATQTCALTADGLPVGITEGQKFDENDPLVRAHPYAFERVVEEATANPGSRRK